MRPGDLAAALGKGLFAGAIGTASMTLSSTAEARLRKREPSTVPAEAASRVLGLEPIEPDAAARLSTVVHWGYGTSWGTVRGVLGMFGLPCVGGSDPQPRQSCDSVGSTCSSGWRSRTS